MARDRINPVVIVTIVVAIFAFAYLVFSGFSQPHIHRNACINNLKQVRGAVGSWQLEQKLHHTNAYSLTTPEILAYFKGARLPQCPLNGSYSAGATLTDHPRCSVPGHSL